MKLVDKTRHRSRKPVIGICQEPGADPEWWFASDPATRNKAIDLCGECRLASDCIKRALSLPPVEGIWAGTTPRQRQQMRQFYADAC